MKRRRILTAILLAAAVLAAVGLWWRMPLSFSQAMGDGFDAQAVTKIEIHLSKVEAREIREGTLTPEDPNFSALLTQLEAQRYHRHFRQTSGQQITLDHIIYLAFFYPAEDGKQATALLSFDGGVLLFMNGHTRTLDGENSQGMQEKLLETLLPLTTPQENASEAGAQ